MYITDMGRKAITALTMVFRNAILILAVNLEQPQRCSQDNTTSEIPDRHVHNY